MMAGVTGFPQCILTANGEMLFVVLLSPSGCSVGGGMQFQNAQFQQDLIAKRVAEDAATNKRAKADNFWFEERVPNRRIKHFETHAQGKNDLFKAAIDYFEIFVKVDGIPSTFDNQINTVDNIDLENDTKLIRMVRLTRGMMEQGINNLDYLRNSKESLKSFFANWKRDKRPAFVTFFEDVEEELKHDDWADRIRERLGLAHLKEGDSVALMCYTVGDVLQGIEEEGWTGRVIPFVAPTVLDMKPSAYFFPSPKELTHGRAMPLYVVKDERNLVREILHLPFKFRAEHVLKLGTIRKVANPPSLREMRNSHLLALRVLSSREDFGEEIPQQYP